MSGPNEFWWQSKGFADVPRSVNASGKETLYRVFGGGSKLYGSCYSYKKPSSVLEAEFCTNIAKWQNQALFVASFRIAKGTPIWIGKIDQRYARIGKKEVDEFIWGDKDAEQVWIDSSKAKSVLTHLFTHQLKQDYHMVFPVQKYDA